MFGYLAVTLLHSAMRSCWAFLDQPPQAGTCATSRRDTAPDAVCVREKAMTHRVGAVLQPCKRSPACKLPSDALVS